MRNIRNGDYMLRKLENEIVKECAPTLAGIKMANLFNYRFVSEDEFDSEIKTANMNLNEKGVYIEVLRKTDMSSLIYDIQNQVCYLRQSIMMMYGIYYPAMDT